MIKFAQGTRKESENLEECIKRTKKFALKRFPNAVFYEMSEMGGVGFCEGESVIAFNIPFETNDN